MTVREKLEIEMDKMETKELEEKNADSEKSDENNISYSNDSSSTAGSDQGKRALGCWRKSGVSSIAGNIAVVAVLF